MNFLNIDYKKAIIFLVLLSMPLIFINIENSKSDSDLFSPIAEISGAFQRAYSGITTGVQGTVQLYLNLVNTRKENRILGENNLRLTAKLSALTELKLENQRLNTLLEFKQNTKMDLRGAKVIGTDLVPDHYLITINKGQQDSIKKNMAVISTGGVIGYITKVFSKTAQVILLTDRYAIIDSVVQRTRARGLVEGIGSDRCRFSYISSTNEDIVEGDVLVTSGLNHIFPKGFPIGKITRVEKDRVNLMQYFELKPAVNIHHLEEVFVVLNTHDESFNPKNEEFQPPSQEEAIQTLKDDKIISKEINQENELVSPVKFKTEKKGP